MKYIHELRNWPKFHWNLTEEVIKSSEIEGERLDPGASAVITWPRSWNGYWWSEILRSKR
jgi:hypothetical protein